MIRALALELARTRSGRTLYPCCVDIHCSDEAIVHSGDLATTRAADDSSHVVGNMARAEEIALAGFFLASDGKVMAQGLATAGAAVVVCSRTLGEAEQTVQDIVGAGGAAAATRVDISDRKSCRDLIEFAVERFGKIDVLVNDAGVTFIRPAEDCTESEWDQTLETNLKGYFLCSQLAARQMMDQGTGGSIVNISSIASTIGAHSLMGYSASKGGVNQITRVMAVEWAPKNIRANAVAPGYLAHAMTGTDLHTRPEEEQRIIALTPMARRGRLEEFVGPVVFLASEASSYMTGAVLFVDGGYTAM